MWYLYVLRCADGSFYAGITTDVQRRVAEHRAGRGAHYTRAHLPVTLVAAWRYPDRSTATRVEYQFKQLTHKAKAAWIKGRWSFMGGPFAPDIFEERTHTARFCPRCGGSLELEPIDGEEVLVCTLCGRRHYRNAKPAAGILILRDDHVLLVRRNCAPFEGFWDIPGGFLRPEEHPVEGALREVREETGLAATDLAFLGFYMDHYEYQDEHYNILNIYFVGKGEGVPRAGDDADDVAWFPLDALPENIAFEHANQVLADLCVWGKQRSADSRGLFRRGKAA